MSTPAMRPFAASLPMALLQAREAAMRLFRPLLAEHGLTEQQWRVLRALTATAAAVDVSDLAERTFLLPPSLSRILTNLEDRNLIVRTVDTTDQRRSLIALSEHGLAQVRLIAPESEQRYAAIEEAFGAERLSRLLDELYDLATLDLGADAHEVVDEEPGDELE
ncbi:MAG: homoprotocatechuate degradation operon regulator HpaR [Ilumatobacter sp.]|uniref:homoprotocatechuate degradation operon regulator HpaR n=1 Tax=Ilumatobacter sp. TaxID=1967498 RepID=UPI002606BAFD|nr:homoprotocatechuate degradation operon regulator HpaR [Ilumatobacter sp.]MDJ0767358.1 homoprotocatechuate degradation operon regulator HpaR [Ilumatobacter sp.]